MAAFWQLFWQGGDLHAVRGHPLADAGFPLADLADRRRWCLQGDLRLAESGRRSAAGEGCGVNLSVGERGAAAQQVEEALLKWT